jgi:hypothetical protein
VQPVLMLRICSRREAGFASTRKRATNRFSLSFEYGVPLKVGVLEVTCMRKRLVANGEHR